jgi:inner membrane protein
MDNICHSLAGAAIAQAGFAKRFPHATLLCVVGANIPDVDASTYLWADSLTALQFRRGWTHGVLALSFWTLLLTALYWWWHRRSTTRLGDIDTTPLPAIFLASLLAVFSHTSLDWLNTYGVRWLMPFSDRWFYGDTLFIVDPALLLLFGAGWWYSRRRIARGTALPERPARIALAFALVYIMGMKGLSEATRSSAERALGMVDASARQLMVSPSPASVLHREVLVRTERAYDWYATGFSGMSVRLGNRLSQVQIGGADLRSVTAATTPQGRAFLRWSRFPYFVPDANGDSASVFIGDARYTQGTGESWAATKVVLK